MPSPNPIGTRKPDLQSAEIRQRRARRRLLGLLSAGGVAGAAGALPGQWRDPRVASVVLPAHAQATAAESATGDEVGDPPATATWSYNNTSIPAGTSPCGNISGPTASNGNVVLPCDGGPYTITSWIIDGNDVAPGTINSDGDTDCGDLHAIFAAAMNALDPNSNAWTAVDSGVATGDGGCGFYMALGEPVAAIYGTMTVTDGSDTWTLNPVSPAP